MYRNKLETYLNKPSTSFTKDDIIRYFIENNFKMLNFRYIAGDGRLKALSFVINSPEHLDNLLTTGERVDGSSLFKYIEAGSSDLYVVPQYRFAFENPFETEPTLDILCHFFTNEGIPLASSPMEIMKKANVELEKATGLKLHVMGELEYYVIASKQELYPANDQRGYHESPPFTKNDYIFKEAMKIIAECGGTIKYGHSEVGNFKQDDKEMEQYEIEFLPVDMEEAAFSLVLTKWILRMLGKKYGVIISYAPKITVGKAGSGLHIHCRLMKNGKSVMINNGKLSTEARRFIAGLLTLAPALTAFGNTIPTSYLRLVPHQEAPTNICWGDRNRSVLIRVPLGWLGNANKMSSIVNPLEKINEKDFSAKQTVEFRCPDGSADIYFLLAGMSVAARIGLLMENALELSDKCYVDVNIFHEAHKEIAKKLNQLPASCYESADALLNLAPYFTDKEVFSPGLIESWAKNLKSFDDDKLSERLEGNVEAIRTLVNKYLYYA